MSPDLLAILMPLKPVLSRNGSILRRKEKDRKPSYRLRYRVSNRHLTIGIPEAEVPAVNSLLASWRGDEQRLKAVELKEKREEAEYQRQDRRDERELILLTGVGRRRKQRLRAIFNEARKAGIIAEVALSYDTPCFWPSPVRGRKRKGGLTVPFTPELGHTNRVRGTFRKNYEAR